MRILVVSDTHGSSRELQEVIRKTKPFDYMIHCGDTEGLDAQIRKAAGTPCTIVRGNNDFFSDAPREEVLTFGKCRIFVTHGHSYGISFGTESLKEEAKSRNCSVALFGHTHRPCLDLSDPDLAVASPGSLAYPRQEGRKPSFLILEIDRFGELHFTLNYLGQRDGSH